MVHVVHLRFFSVVEQDIYTAKLFLFVNIKAIYYGDGKTN